MSIVTYAEAGAANEPSPSIWKDCPMRRLVDEGMGYYFHEEFLGGPVSTAFLPIHSVGTGIFSFIGDTDTVVAFKA
ncbi:hypothetical protein LCGC14_1529690, partial [marine sediment metagenome]